MEGFYGANRIVESRERKITRERGALPKEECDAIGEYKAMHAENLLSSWIREDGEEKEERTAKMSDKNSEERSEKRKSEGEKEENKTVSVKRKCDVFVSVEAFEIFTQGGDLESCGDLSWEDLVEEPKDLSDRELETRLEVTVVLDVTDVLVSPSSVPTLVQPRRKR